MPSGEIYPVTNHLIDRWVERFGTGLEELERSFARSVRVPIKTIINWITHNSERMNVRPAMEYHFDQEGEAMFIVTSDQSEMGRVVVTVIPFRRPISGKEKFKTRVGTSHPEDE